MTRNKLYVFLSTACTVGLVWLIIAYNRNISGEVDGGVCLFKRITSLPCPSCGSSRSVLALLKGDLSGAFRLNPFGFIVLAVMVTTPVWIIIDLIYQKATLFSFFTKAESFLSRKWVAVSGVLIVLLNWIWNIYKGA